MTGKVEYLERYSVAPSPSRDYHGLKILRDEVILYVWRISHGPHKAPILRRSKFFEFDQDKALQDEIGRIFGDHLVNYVKLIARGKGNSLLTLPRSSIERIVGYLKLEDIVNLTTLSRIANVVFNDNFVWEALYRRHKSFKIGRTEREYAMAYGWKQAFKEKQMALSTDRRKAIGSTTTTTTTTTTAGKREKLKMQQQGSTRPVSGSLKLTSKSSSTSTKVDTVRSVQVPQKSATNFLRSLKDPEMDEAPIKLEKKGNTRVKKSSNAKIRQTKNTKSLRNDKSSVQLVESKHNIREAFSDSMTATRKSGDGQRVKHRKSSVSAKIDNVRATDKGKIGDSKKNVSDRSHLSSIRSRNEQAPKGKEKPKKPTQIKSTSSSVDESFLQDTASVLGNENCELAYLIEESLKRIRSPRTVFDYDFSYLEGSKTLVNAKKGNEESRKSTTTIEDTNLRNQNGAKLDRLSEYSDSLGTPSTNSVIENRGEKTRVKKSKGKVESKGSTVRSGRIERSIGSYETSSKESPKETLETYDINRSIPRGALNSINIMKSLRPGNQSTKSIATSGKSVLGTATKNRFALKKNLDESRKDRMIDKTD